MKMKIGFTVLVFCISAALLSGCSDQKKKDRKRYEVKWVVKDGASEPSGKILCDNNLLQAWCEREDSDEVCLQALKNYYNNHCDKIPCDEAGGDDDDPELASMCQNMLDTRTEIQAGNCGKKFGMRFVKEVVVDIDSRYLWLKCGRIPSNREGEVKSILGF